MKTAMTMLLSVLLSLSVGCAGKQESKGEKTKLRYWTQGIHDLQYVKKRVEQFNREHPDVEVEITSQVGAQLAEQKRGAA